MIQPVWDGLGLPMLLVRVISPFNLVSCFFTLVVNMEKGMNNS